MACGVGILEQDNVGKVIHLGCAEGRGEGDVEVACVCRLTRSLNLHPSVVSIVHDILVIGVGTFGVAVVNASVLVYV